GAYSSQSYVPSSGRDLYRRGLYTYWKRSLPHPALVALDAPTRELCTVARPRTNTPLQALVLLNDPAQLEAARALALRALAEAGPDAEARSAPPSRLSPGRYPDAAERRVLARVLDEQLRHYREHLAAARDFTGEVPPGLDVPALAAWTAIGNLLLNLDE